MTEKKDVIPVQSAFLRESMTVEDVVGHVKMVREAVSKVMEKGENKDYGLIPGTEKPTLFKSGAEKLCVLFRLAPSFETTEYWDGQHLTVKSKCVLTHINSGKVVGSGDAICSTKEKKYAKRKQNGKYIDNNELPDLYNTIIKMADKRALIAGVLVVTAASSEFTQDRGDDEKPDDHPDDAPKGKEPMKEIEGKSEVKEAPQSKALTDSKVWVGVLSEVSPMVNAPTKFLKINSADGFVVLYQQPSEKAKADLDLYKAIWKDIAAWIDAKEEVAITYGISAKGNNLFQGIKLAEKSVLA